jgi:transposase-like protein
MPKIPPYSLEFRSEAVRLLRSSGRSVPQLARELGVSPQSLRNWSGQLDVDEGKAEGLSSAERDELRPVASRESGPRRGAGDPKKSGGLLRQGRRDPVSVYRFIAAEKAAHSIAIMCRVLEVSRSGYHAWTQWPLGPRAREDARLTERIRELHKKRRGVYGSPRIWSDLTVDDGERIGRKRVERLMRQAGPLGPNHEEVAHDDGSCARRARRGGGASPQSCCEAGHFPVQRGVIWVRRAWRIAGRSPGLLLCEHGAFGFGEHQRADGDDVYASTGRDRTTSIPVRRDQGAGPYEPVPRTGPPSTERVGATRPAGHPVRR